MSALDARAWLTTINGIGMKTASVVLLFSFGLPLMPVDRHVERVALRVGLHPEEGDGRRGARPVPGLLEPDEMHEAHVNLIRHGRLVCHAQRPATALPAAPALPLRGPEGALTEAYRGSTAPDAALSSGHDLG